MTESGTKGSGSGTSKSAPHPADYYEGYWLCSGFEKNGETVGYGSLSSEERDSYPYLILEMGKSGGTLSQVTNGDGEYRMLFGGDSRATSDGVVLINDDDSLRFVVNGEKLVMLPEDAAGLQKSTSNIGLYPGFSLPQGEATYFFQKTDFGGQPRVVTYRFDDITLDVPVDIAYSLEATSTVSHDNGSVSINGVSYRRYGPQMTLFTWPTEVNNIAEVIAEAEGQDYCIEHADEFIEYEGVVYYLHHNEELNYSRLGFVVNGKLYEIDFDYDDRDVVDYSDYCKYFFTSIRFASDVPAVGQDEAIPPGAISWQEVPQHVGESVTIYGPVATIEYASTSDGQPTFIDLGVAYPDTSRVTMVIWGENRAEFPGAPESLYADKTLCVTGEVYMYEGVCNIEVASPSQVQVL